MPQNDDILPNCVQHAKAMREVEEKWGKKMALKSFEEYVEDRHIRVEQLKDKLKAACSELGIPYTSVETNGEELPDQLKPDPKTVDEFWTEVAHACNLPAWVFGVEGEENDERN